MMILMSIDKGKKIRNQKAHSSVSVFSEQYLQNCYLNLWREIGVFLHAQNAVCFPILCVTASKMSRRISITAFNALLELMSPLSKCSGRDANVDSPSVSGAVSVLTSSV